ncbi:uncharacterized protein C9orf152-like [Onychostoma macrolepis]|uniref:TBC1 domain-containing protein n=1 Tax=Onychostoma macrolepis TaxID=369639 RepID=A0A7J6BKE3_9TELE|nr:uncharacterized protein C9orf152-like [Onychostoma macrolepis]KAF4095508.1 hypothetical protein G5714_023111 [Onychostoma macrolepis]
MWLCCCSYLACADVWGEIRTEEEDQSSVRMDIELLEEQYSSIREKQRRQTQVICFRKAQNDEEISGINLLDVVPVCQIKRSPSTKAPETWSERVVDSDSGLWRSHLDLHRIKHTTEETEQRNNSAASTEASSTSSESERLSEDSNPGEPHLKIKNSRKFSAPAVLSHQLSLGSYRSTPAGSKYYPFPQKKTLRKSETARRLGLYASL